MGHDLYMDCRKLMKRMQKALMRFNLEFDVKIAEAGR